MDKKTNKHKDISIKSFNHYFDNFLLFFGVLCFVLAIVMIGLLIFDRSNFSPADFQESLFGVFVMLICFGCCSLMYIANKQNRSSASPQKESEDYYNDLRKKVLRYEQQEIFNNEESQQESDPVVIQGVPGSGKSTVINSLIEYKLRYGMSADTVELLLANLKEIKEYYAMNKQQARTSFRIVIVTSVLGFMMIASSIALIFVKDTNFVLAFIPAIGGVISEFIAASSVTVYKNVTKQMATYYQGLHENESLYLAAMLGEKVSDGKQDEMHMKVMELILTPKETDKKTDKETDKETNK